MELRITGRDDHVTDAMRSYADEKCDRLERHNDMLMRADLVLNIEKAARHSAEMIAHTKVGHRLIAKAEHTDMYAAIDLLVDKMDQQLTKEKERVKQERKHARTKTSGAKTAGARQAGKSGRGRPPAPESPAPPPEAEEEEAEEGEAAE